MSEYFARLSEEEKARDTNKTLKLKKSYKSK